jgi:hypothetical protein
MASVRVRFSPGFPLGGGFPAEQFASAWRKETAGGEERLLLQSSNCSLEEGVPGRTATAVFGFPKRGEFPGEQTVWFLLWRYSKYAEHLRKLVFCSGGILFGQSTTWLFCSTGNPPPGGNPGLKCTRTDAMLKNFEFKMNFKLKINAKRDRTNFRSIQ